MAGYRESQLAAGRSPGTIRLHRCRLFWLAQIRTAPAAITPGDLVKILATDGWAPETRKSVGSTLRAFFAWATETGVVDVDPSASLPSVRVPAPASRPAPDTALTAALTGCDERTWLMVMLATYAGLRCCEIARVHGDHFVEGMLRVEDKGRKPRVVPVMQPELRRRLETLNGWAFPNRCTGQPMTPGHITRLVSRQMPDGWTAHTLRHRMATRAYAGTRDLLAVGALLGHSRPETTQRYVRLPDNALTGSGTSGDLNAAQAQINQPINRQTAPR